MSQTVILNSLATVRRRVRLLGLLHGIGLFVVAAAALLSATVFLDYLLNLPAVPRLVLILGSIVGMGYAVMRWIIKPLLAKLRLTDVAGRIEETFPVFEDRLRSVIDFNSRPSNESEVMKRRVMDQAMTLAADVDLQSVVRPRPAWTALGAGGLALLICLMLAMVMGPDFLGAAMSRLLTPFAGRAWPKRTEIALLNQVPSRVAAGTPVEVRIKLVKGDRPSAKAIIYYQYDKNGPVEQEMMTRNSDGSYSANLDARIEPGQTAGIMSVWMKSGDDGKNLPPVQVVPPLTIKQVMVVVTPPKYADLPPVTLDLASSPATITERSGVDLQVTFNRPLAPGQSMRLDSADSQIAAPAIQWANVAPGSLTATGHFVAKQSSRFKILGTDEDHFTNNGLEEYQILVRPDQIPSVQFEKPIRNQDATIDATLPIQGVAEDDFGIKKLDLMVSRLSDKKSWTIPLIQGAKPAADAVQWTKLDATGDRLRFRANWDWQLSQLEGANLKAGDQLEFYLRVQDNYEDDQGQPHNPPYSESGRLRVTIINTQELIQQLNDELGQLRAQVEDTRKQNETLRIGTKSLQQDTQNKPNLDRADRATANQLANDQSAAASQAKQVADKLAEMQNRIQQNQSQSAQANQALKELTDNINAAQRLLNGAAENPMRQAASRLSQLADQNRFTPDNTQNPSDQQGQQNPNNANPSQQQQQSASSDQARTPSNQSRENQAGQNQTAAGRQNDQSGQQNPSAANAGDRNQQNQTQQNQQGQNPQNSATARNGQQNQGQQNQTASANARGGQQNQGQQNQNGQNQNQQNANAQNQGQQNQTASANPRGGQQNQGQQNQNGQNQNQQNANAQNQGQQNQTASANPRGGQQNQGQQNQGQQNQSGQNQGQQNQTASANQRSGAQNQGQQNQGQQSQGQQNQTASGQQQQQSDRQATQQASARGEQLQQTQQDQAAASEQLQQAMDKMGAQAGLAQFLKKVADLLDQQRKLSNQTAQASKDTLGKDPSQLNDDQKKALNDLAQQQKDLAKQTDQALQQMNQSADRQARSDPSSAQALQQAAQTGQQQNVSGEMQQAGQAEQQNQQASAQTNQRQAELGLMMMQRQLQEAENRHLLELMKQLDTAQQLVADLLQQQAGHNLDNLALQGGTVFADAAKTDPDLVKDLIEASGRDPLNLPDPAALETQVDLQAQTERNTRNIVATVQALPEGADPAEQLTRAAQQMSRAVTYLQDRRLSDAYQPPQVEAFAALLSAKDTLSKQSAAAQQRAADQQKETLRQQFVALRADQAKINDQTKTIDATPRATDGQLGHQAKANLGILSDDQSKLAVRAAKLDDDLSAAGSVAYTYANNDIVARMNKVKDELSKFDPTKPTQQAQERIVRELDDMIKNLAMRPRQSQFSNPRNGDDNANQGQGQGGQQNGQPKPPQLPAEAEVRLIQSMQKMLNEDTKDAAAAKADKSAVLDLGKRQGDLRNLLDSILQKSSEGQVTLGPEPENKDTLPEEAKDEDLDLQELKDSALNAKPDAQGIADDTSMLGIRMSRARQRLALSADDGTTTQKIQDRIVIEMDGLANMAGQQQQQQARSRTAVRQARQGQPRPGQQRPGQQGQPNNAQANGQRQGDPANQQQQRQQNANARNPRMGNTNGLTTDPDTSAQIDQLKDSWGKLAPRERSAFLEGATDQTIQQFKDFVDSYYRTLATKAQQPQQ